MKSSRLGVSISIKKSRMIANSREKFEEIEVEHDCRTYYVSGFIDFEITQSIGGSYEGYAFEVVYEREICDITITDLWYYDEESGDGVDVLGVDNYREIEKLAEDEIRYKYE